MAQAAAVSMRKVSRSRLFTPRTVAPASSARASSSGVCTSTSASSPASRAQREQRRESRRRCSARTMSSTAGGARRPRLDDLELVENEVLPEHAARRVRPTAARRSSIEPPKNGPSVSTEIAAAPWRA